jgi:hypothetical protein
VRCSGELTGFVGVMANIPDCRSVATGSIPVRTAKHVAAFQFVGFAWNEEDAPILIGACYTIHVVIRRYAHANELSDSVIGNISEFESDVLSSNLSPVTVAFFSLFGKHLIVNTGFDSRRQP